MLLAIDIGNTTISVGRFRDGRLLGSGRLPTVPGSSADELEAGLEAFLRAEGSTLEAATSICLVSVVPDLTAAMTKLAAHRGIELLVASATTIPIPIRLDQPDQVGPDRLVNAFAAARLHGVPAVVVDLGTASTFDAVAGDGAFLGGAIAPGLTLGIDALASRTAMLPRIEIRAPKRAIGRTTVEAIEAGAILGYAELVTGLVARIRAELAAIDDSPGRDIRTILTGGLSRGPLAAEIEGMDIVDPELTLKGLAILHAEVTQGAKARREPTAGSRR